jgi:gamma-polyglutamate biosynthesis protein CapA
LVLSVKISYLLKKIYLFLLVFLSFFTLVYLLIFVSSKLVFNSSQEKLEKFSSSSLISEPDLSPTPAPLVFSMIIGGDLMFDRHIRTKAEIQGSYDFIFDEDLSNFLNSADYASANLEGPITQEKSVSQYSSPGGPGNYTFTFSPEIIPVLQKNNLSILNFGNNHVLNFGQAGLESTQQYLEQANLDFFGDVGVSEDWQRYHVLEHFGQKIALISYNQFVAGAKNKTLYDLNESKNQGASLILLFAHWGNEYVPVVNQAIVDLAHEFIEAGADLIIGGHPHVVQNKEIYQGKTIYYSLGNFVFDQYFSAETQEGLLLKINFTFDPDTENWTYQIFEQAIRMSKDGVTRLYSIAN